MKPTDIHMADGGLVTIEANENGAWPILRISRAGVDGLATLEALPGARRFVHVSQWQGERAEAFFYVEAKVLGLAVTATGERRPATPEEAAILREEDWRELSSGRRVRLRGVEL